MHRLTVMMLICLAMAACVHKRGVERTLRPPAEVTSLDRQSEYLKVHMRDGSLFILEKWTAPADANIVEGTGHRLGVLRDTVASGQLRVPIDSVLLFETNVLRKPGPSTALTVFTVITAGIGLACAANPKACFGSCPTFYAGDQQHILAEGFSASIAPALEASDVDRLEIPPAAGGEFVLRMTNEAYETHVIRSARLLAFPSRTGEEVYATANSFWRVSDLVAPDCRAAEGSCTAAIAAADRNERFSTTDSADLAKRELLELSFSVDQDGDYGLVLTSRQTLVHTFVLYQTLAYLGTRAGEYIASLSRGDLRRMRSLLELGRTMGGIEIGRPDADDFLATIYETGPLATDSHLLQLGTLSPGRHTVRIRMAKGQWRIDRIAIARMLAPVQPIALEPVQLTRNGVTDSAALQGLHGGAHPLVSMPGDEYRLTFQLPSAERGHTLFLQSRGYYLEWMRDEWLREENAAKAQLILDEPAAGLKMLAPAFKQWEPRMEQLFWSSRYVRD